MQTRRRGADSRVSVASRALSANVKLFRRHREAVATPEAEGRRGPAEKLRWRTTALERERHVGVLMPVSAHGPTPFLCLPTSSLEHAPRDSPRTPTTRSVA